MTWWNTLLLVVLALATIATCVNSEQDEKQNEEVKKRSVEDEDVMEAEAMAMDDGAADADKRSRLFRYGRGGLMRYGKRAPSVFRYGKRAPAVFRYGKRSDDDAEAYADDDMDVKRLFRWGKRSDLTNDDVKRLFRWGKRGDYDEAAVMAALADEDLDKRTVFRYGKRDSSANDKKRRVFRFGKRAGQLDLDDFKYGRDTRNPDQPHVPFRFGDD